MDTFLLQVKICEWAVLLCRTTKGQNRRGEADTCKSAEVYNKTRCRWLESAKLYTRKQKNWQQKQSLL